MLLDHSIVRLVNKLANKIRRTINIQGTSPLFTGAQGRILHYIIIHSKNKSHPLFQKNIEEEFGLRPSSASELLRKLEEQGLIKRQAWVEDGRRKEIIPTAKALAKDQLAEEEFLRIEELLRQKVAAEDLEIFFKVIKQIHQNLD